MANIEDAKIQELSKKADEGQGCALRDEFMGHNLNEQIAAIQSLRNLHNPKGDPVTAVSSGHPLFVSKGESDSIILSAMPVTSAPLFVEKFDMKTGQTTYTCTDKKQEGK